MGFFAFVVAPAAFSTLDRDAAGRFVGAVFPKYYAVGFGLPSTPVLDPKFTIEPPRSDR